MEEHTEHVDSLDKMEMINESDTNLKYSPSNENESHIVMVDSNEPPTKLTAYQRSTLEKQSGFTSEDVKHKILTEKAKMNIKPHLKNAIRDYLEMVREEKDFKYQPEWDSSKQWILRDMIDSKRTHLLVWELLKNKREEQAKIRIERANEINELKKEQEQFGESFVYFDKFVKENIEKRERAYDKIQTEKEVQAQLDKELVETDEKIKRLIDVKDDMLKCIADRKIFVDYLEKVRAIAANQFRFGVHEIAERYELLIMIREELADKQLKSIDVMQELSNNIFKITNDKIEELMSLKNKITELYVRHDLAKHQALHWNNIVNKIEKTIANRNTQLIRVKDACWNLYLQMCEQNREQPTLERNQIRKQLSVIEQNITRLRKTIHMLKKKQNT